MNFCYTLGPFHSCDVGVQCCPESSWVFSENSVVDVFSENPVVEAIATSKAISGVKVDTLTPGIAFGVAIASTTPRPPPK